jgi:putative sigma-54 modulation protein
MKIQTEIHHFAADAQLLSTVEQKLSKLQLFFNRISEARVLLKLDDTDTKKQRIAEVKIHFPNGIIFIKESSKTFEAALDKAMVAIKCQLIRCKIKKQLTA